MKRVSFEVAKAIKEAGYSQGNEDTAYYNENGILVKPCVFNGGKEIADAPTYMEVWLWLWREKTIRFSVEDLWDGETAYSGRGCTSSTNQFGGICTPEFSDPEEAIIAAIDYLVKHKMISLDLYLISKHKRQRKGTGVFIRGL